MTKKYSVNADDAVSRDRQPGRSRFYEVRVSERAAWFGATAAALFNALGMLLEVEIIRKFPGISPRPAFISASVGFALLVMLLIRRKTPSRQWASVAYTLNTISVVTALLGTNLQFAVFDGNWVPFQASKLGSLVAALLAPGFWVGLLSVLAYCVSAWLQFEFFFPSELKGQMVGEPWPTLAFGLAGIFALVYRFRQVQLEQELARIRAQNLAIKELARTFLNIRDRMNTPLQVIELSLSALRNSNDLPKPLLDRIDRSVQSLTTINAVLVQHEREIEGQAKQ